MKIVPGLPRSSWSTFKSKLMVRNMFKTAIRATAALLVIGMTAVNAHAVQVFEFQLADPSQPYRMSEHLISNNYLDSRTYLANGSATVVYDDINHIIDLTVLTTGSLYGFHLVNGVQATDYDSGPVATGVTTVTTLRYHDVVEDSPFALLGDPDMNKSEGHFTMSTLALAGDPSQGASFDIAAKPMDWNLDPSTDGFIDEMRPYGLRTFWMYFANHNWGDDRFIDPAELVFNLWATATGPVTAGSANYVMATGDYHGSMGAQLSTPEPATLLLLGSGVVLVGRRRSKKSA